MLKKLLLIPLVALSLVSCQKVDESGIALNNYSKDDGYFFEKVDFVRDNLAISIVFYPDHESLVKAGVENHRIKVADGYQLHAFSFWLKNRSSCQIHIVDPKIKYDPTALGHEMTHCIYGEFHPSRNVK